MPRMALKWQGTGGQNKWGKSSNASESILQTITKIEKK